MLLQCSVTKAANMWRQVTAYYFAIQPPDVHVCVLRNFFKVYEAKIGLIIYLKNMTITIIFKNTDTFTAPSLGAIMSTITAPRQTKLTNTHV